MKKKILSITLTFVTALSLLMATSCSLPKVNQLFCKHEYETEIVKNATCTEQGEKKYTCTLCEYEKIEKIKASDHAIVEDEAVSPSCLENGKTLGQRCAVCGLVLKEQQIIPAPGHALETIPGKGATCSETGLTEGAYCTVCEKVIIEQQEISLLNCEDLDGDLKCDMCKEYITARMTEVDVKVGEAVAGHWYRLYKYNGSTSAVKLGNLDKLSENYDFSSIYLYNDHEYGGFPTNSYGNYLFTYMPGYSFDNDKYIFTDEYIDIYIGEGSTISAGTSVYARITAGTVIVDIAEGVVFKRLV